MTPRTRRHRGLSRTAAYFALLNALSGAWGPAVQSYVTGRLVAAWITNHEAPGEGAR